MSALPCTSFIPMVFHEMVFCSSCGFSSDFHQNDPVGDIQVNENNQHYPQQPSSGLAVCWQNPDQMEDHPPLDYDNNVETNTKHTLSNQLMPDENVKHRIFNPYQVRRMIDKACALQWTLKGRSQDVDIDQFCKDIGVGRAQFGKWVYRTRRRLAGRR